MPQRKRERADVTGVHGESRRGSNGGKARAGRRQEPAPIVRLPLASGWASQFRALEPGQEPRRRSCGNYDRCLAAYRGHGDATCPDPCARYVEPDRLRATDYTSVDGQARGAA